MAYETAKQVLDHLRELHGRLATFYAGLKEQVPRERVQLFLDYLRSRERELEVRLGEFEAQAGEGVLNTWYAFTPEDGIAEQLEAVELGPDMSIDEVLKTALLLDECIVAVYRKLAEKAPSAELKEVFEGLLAQESGEERRVTRIAEDIQRFM